MKKHCQKCLGTGWEQDAYSIGRSMWQQRQAAGMSIAELAKRLGLDPSYLSYLEAGKRDWSLDLRDRYVKALSS